MNNKLKILTERRLVVTLLLGFASGLPLTLSGSTLQVWFTESGLSLTALGWMGLAGLPYTYKFLWAPLLDRFVPPFLGRRRGWILVFQILLMLTLFAMAALSPSQTPKLLFALACLLALLSASQDIAVDAYRTDILPQHERILGASMVVNGYRTAMLVSGGLGLVLAHEFGFHFTYVVMGILMCIGMIGNFLGPDPIKVSAPRTFRESTIMPFLEFFSRPYSLIILLFIIFYELGNSFASSLISPFLIRELHLTKLELGTLVKFVGFAGVILGSLTAGLLAIRWSIYRSMFLFGVLQALGNLAYLILFWTGANYWAIGSVIFLDNFTGGMGQAALVGFLMSLCNPKFTAFQYATLSSLAILGRVLIGPFAGFVAERYGWEMYFYTSLFLSIPGLILLFYMKNGIDKTNRLLNNKEELAPNGA